MIEKISCDEKSEDPVIYQGTVYILRGLPGCGKSTIAKILAGNQDRTKIVSADDYFIAQGGPNKGKYIFDPTKLKDAHDECKAYFCDYIALGVDPIIVDNTNTQQWEMDFYVDKAKEYNYFVQIITVGEFSDKAVDNYTKTNTHGVPKDNILKMRNRFKLI